MIEKKAPGREFPPGFLWGTATSPTQIEGETVNDWRAFAANDRMTADDGPRHWQYYREDLGLLRRLNQNAYRLGFDWARLQAEPCAEFDRAAADRYIEIIDRLRAEKIEPFLTLFHFGLPPWFAVRGGWTNGDAITCFADYAGRVARMVRGRVRYFVTHNEPAVYAIMCYVFGNWPPCRKMRIDLAYRTLGNLERAHARAYDEIKRAIPDAQIGIAKHFKNYVPYRGWHPLDVAGAKAARLFFDWMSLKKFVNFRGRRVADFVGVNFYGRLRMKGCGGLSPLLGYERERLAEMGIVCDDMWEEDAAYLPSCLAQVARRTGLPVFITENGTATDDEDRRTEYLLRHVRATRDALTRGVDVRGYFYWSLLDNLEWTEGFSKKFGLVGVDFAHPDRPRQVRPAAQVYAEIARTNTLPE